MTEQDIEKIVEKGLKTQKGRQVFYKISRCYAGNLLEDGQLANQTERGVVGTATRRFIAKNERSFHEIKLHNST